MPSLTLSIMQGQSAEQKKILLRAVTEAVQQSIGASLASIRIALSEFAPDHVIVAGQIGHPMARCDAALIAGRNEAQKAAFIAAVNEAISVNTGISNQDIRVVVNDVPNTNMGVAGGVTAKSTGR